MRLPFSNIYRPFPELDAFPDHECKRLVRRASRRMLKWMWIPGSGLVMSFVGVEYFIRLATTQLSEELREIARFTIV